jgi:hypothetical protein
MRTNLLAQAFLFNAFTHIPQREGLANNALFEE